MSAAAPAARCRNRRGGSFMAFLPGMQRHSESDAFSNVARRITLPHFSVSSAMNCQYSANPQTP
jgi:hypothetical protein